MRAIEQGPRVRPHSRDAIDPGFVEIGLVQLSMIHTRTHRPTDKLHNGTLYAPRYEEDFLTVGKIQPRSLRSLGLVSLLVERLINKEVA